MIEIVLPVLFEKTNSIDLNCRHGATLAVGEVIHALSRISQDNNGGVNLMLPGHLLEKTKALIPHYRQRMYFRGLGGELMKQACSLFIEKCSLSALPFHNDIVIGNLRNFMLIKYFFK